MLQDKILKILLTQIDEPTEALRSRFDQDQLADLAESIRTNGLIQPIVVKSKGDRFEVVAGHRRLQAHRLLKLSEIEAIVKDYTDEQAESAKLHENLFREDINAVDEAVFLAKYIERTKCGLEELSRMLNRSSVWVRQRLEILEYPDYLIKEVAEGRIKITVAQQLSKIENELIKQDYTRFAALQGINVLTAKKWVEQSKAGTLPANPVELPPGENIYHAESAAIKTKCMICQQMDELARQESFFAHADCVLQMEREMAKAAQAATPPIQEKMSGNEVEISNLVRTV